MAADLTGRTINGRYRIKRLLGMGGMGCVYLAEDLHAHGASRALKMLRSELTHDARVRHRFIDEAKSLARLEHPNIVRAHDFFCVGEDCFIALAFVDGVSLADLIDRHGALPEAQALHIIKGVLSALDHGHQQLVVHRDVKPSNILLDQASGEPLLCDFGIAKQMAERGVTMAGATIGTAEYMSPEQVLTPDMVDLRSDVYSAGIVLFEMLTGRVPFKVQPGDSDFAVRNQQMKSLPPNPKIYNPAIDDRLVSLVMKALRKVPATRHQGCGAFRQAIERYEQGEAPPPPPAVSVPGQRRYSVYGHPTLGHAAVKQGFSFPAMVAGIFWMFNKGLYSQAAKWAGAYFAVFLMLSSAGGASGWLSTLALASLPVMWVLPGFFGNAWREAELRRRGFELKGAFPAKTADAAVARATRGH